MTSRNTLAVLDREETLILKRDWLTSVERVQRICAEFSEAWQTSSRVQNGSGSAQNAGLEFARIRSEALAATSETLLRDLEVRIEKCLREHASQPPRLDIAQAYAIVFHARLAKKGLDMAHALARDWNARRPADGEDPLDSANFAVSTAQARVARQIAAPLLSFFGAHTERVWKLRKLFRTASVAAATASVDASLKQTRTSNGRDSLMRGLVILRIFLPSTLSFPAPLQCL
jgi:hypothetical protein